MHPFELMEDGDAGIKISVGDKPLTAAFRSTAEADEQIELLIAQLRSLRSLARRRGDQHGGKPISLDYA